MAACIVAAGAFCFAAPKPPRGKYSVEQITLKLFDRATGKFVSFEKPPNPYGMDLDVLVFVKVKGPSTPGTQQPPFDVTLLLDTPATKADEAGNDAQAPTHRELSSKALNLPELGVGYYMFPFPWVCNTVNLTARVETKGEAPQERTKKVELGCAE